MIRGAVALVGSGELSGTMVETHKWLLERLKPEEKALFLDTPAGFQENVDLLSRRAVDFFEKQVLHPMEVASFKAAEAAAEENAERTYHLLGEAGYVLLGPGSPTYAVRQLKQTPIPALLSAMVTRGGCLTVASAAALTAGTHTLPVYEIYKVGETLHWVEGLNILGNLGLDLVVIPHWNNAEGGNHDTRFCYMGEKRFRALEEQLPAGTTILGIDEHTACVLDFHSRLAYITGIGRVTVRRSGSEQVYNRGEQIGFEQILQGSGAVEEKGGSETDSGSFLDRSSGRDSSFWDRMHAIEAAFHRALDQKDPAAMVTRLLEADGMLWQAQLDLENPEFISQGREIFREMIVLAGTGIDQAAAEIPRKFETLVAGLVELREKHRQEKKYFEADQIRSLLHKAGVVVEDTREGPRWRS